MKGVIYFIILVLASGLTCRYFIKDNIEYADHYNKNEIIEADYTGSYRSDKMPVYDLLGFHNEYTVVKYDEEVNSERYLDNTFAALFFDDTDKKALVAHNVHRRIYPASMTKLVTAILACDAIESGKLELDEIVNYSHDIDFDEYNGAMHSDFYAGYSITLRNLMYGFMMCSYNDFGVVIAELVAGSEDAFCDMMNQKMKEIGATNCHFANTHGLHLDDHYVTAYDMYLIINEASKHPLLQQIDSYSSYTMSFYDEFGDLCEWDIEPTNRFVNHNVKLPSNIKIKEWKTGTTGMAGYCLAMKVEINDKEYTVVVADSESSDDLYNTISAMFNLANN
ncbi:MAG: serine hydrolase [Eubacterium sp.]|nr:serine hydrolase [Eubacterium sp.]